MKGASTAALDNWPSVVNTKTRSRIRETMWYSDAEDYISYGLLGAAVFFVWSLALAHSGRPHNAVRIISLVGLAFGMGLYLGIASTAKGSFYLPLGVMQTQMHEMWEIPLTNLRPGFWPKDIDDPLVQ
jgi:hypothetical protein